MNTSPDWLSVKKLVTVSDSFFRKIMFITYCLLMLFPTNLKPVYMYLV